MQVSQCTAKCRVILGQPQSSALNPFSHIERSSFELNPESPGTRADPSGHMCVLLARKKFNVTYSSFYLLICISTRCLAPSEGLQGIGTGAGCHLKHSIPPV
ncbi:hypothetical protein D3C81_927450 [compost metagenome]